ncbi:MAG: hypothetical protein QW076_06385 [Candidatus Anstonellales archaeon]
MNDKTLIIITAIVCLTILEIFNIIYFKIDGFILSLVIGSIAGLAGYNIKSLVNYYARIGKNRREIKNFESKIYST